MDKLTLFERQIIESGIRVGKSLRAIARSLNRDHKAIQYEVKEKTVSGRDYSAVVAERLSVEREKKRHQPKLTHRKNILLKKYVVDCIVKDWSPEQISGILKNQPPKELKGATLSPETIYQYIYQGEGRYEKLFKHLRRGRKKRQQNGVEKLRKPVFLNEFRFTNDQRKLR